MRLRVEGTWRRISDQPSVLRNHPEEIFFIAEFKCVDEAGAQ
jgi:hypothetical protein